MNKYKLTASENHINIINTFYGRQWKNKRRRRKKNQNEPKEEKRKLNVGKNTE